MDQKEDLPTNQENKLEINKEEKNEENKTTLKSGKKSSTNFFRPIRGPVHEWPTKKMKVGTLNKKYRPQGSDLHFFRGPLFVNSRKNPQKKKHQQKKILQKRQQQKKQLQKKTEEKKV